MLRNKIAALILITSIIFILIPAATAPAAAAGDVIIASEQEYSDAESPAERLYILGLFKGVGENDDGTPDFDLDRAPNRAEAITMVVRLMGKEKEALDGKWETPFTDVFEWAQPYVGYAYASGFTVGTSGTTFGSADLVSASEFLTFILRALGYSSSNEFRWDEAWVLSDSLGVTSGEYNAETNSFKRSDVAHVSCNALTATEKSSGDELYKLLIENGAISEDKAERLGITAGKYSFDEELLSMYMLADLNEIINCVNVYNWGSYPMNGVSDEQKVAFALVMSNAKEGEQISAGVIEAVISDYFAVGVSGHKSIDSNYLKAEYIEDSYRIIKPPSVGAIEYSFSIGHSIISQNNTAACKTDLRFYHAGGADLIGEVKVILAFDNERFKIISYSQIIYDEPVVLENNV